MNKARFTPLYILANLGAFIAFLPLLVLLLPRRVAAIAADEPITLLSWLLLVGGVTASLANIAAGAFSDYWIRRHGNRRMPIALGLAALLASYALFADARTPLTLFAAIIVFQASFNLMFAPIGALLADHVPHARKGWIAGWLGMALPLAGLAITLLGYLGSADSGWPFLLLAGIIAALILPLLIAWPADLPLIAREEPPADRGAALGRDFALAWVARLTVQTGAAIMLSYLYLYVDGIASGAAGYPDQAASAGVATLSLIATIMSLGAGIIAGRISDVAGKRRVPLALTACGVALALALLAWGSHWGVILAAYALFTACLTAFLSVDSALVAQMLAGHRRRGTYLGLMNLTNTLPAIIAPSAALLLSSGDLPGGALRLLIGLGTLAALVAAASVMGIRSVR
ncbi:MFS transporter [Sphingomicrobium lutaoense]|uniref:MFS family permease n=1 Tax=Sphingomicrobium lutaoense TaxID=515949 RepID=A0A839Z1X6_9SPHN|nr:MFS transporter [Sphingomicrobium lutaoense]MBB3763595.1 MFS family permease [Sphingomicrobium lutaoense]